MIKSIIYLMWDLGFLNIVQCIKWLGLDFVESPREEVGIVYIKSYQVYVWVSFDYVRMQDEFIDDFSITIGLHQGSTISAYLFTLVLDVLTEHV